MVKDVVAVVTETQCAPAPASDCAILVGAPDSSLGAKNRRLRVQFRAVASACLPAGHRVQFAAFAVLTLPLSHVLQVGWAAVSW